MLRFDVLSFDLQAVLVLELLYTAASVSKLLLACKERAETTACVVYHSNIAIARVFAIIFWPLRGARP